MHDDTDVLSATGPGPQRRRRYPAKHRRDIAWRAHCCGSLCPTPPCGALIGTTRSPAHYAVPPATLSTTCASHSHPQDEAEAEAGEARNSAADTERASPEPCLLKTLLTTTSFALTRQKSSTQLKTREMACRVLQRPATDKAQSNGHARGTWPCPAPLSFPPSTFNLAGYSES